METPTPFDLNEAIRRWQQDLGASPAFQGDNLEELASHLRASVQKLQADGLSEEEAFQIAARRIGEQGPLEREFAKVNPSPTHSLPLFLFWIVAGLYLWQLVYSLICGILTQMLMLELKHLQGIGALPIYQRYETFSLHYYPLATSLSPVMVLILILGARLAVGNWKKFGAIIRIFEHPILAVLGLVVIGHAAIILPKFFPSFNEAWAWHYLAGMPVVNNVLVLLMVLLARRELRKKSSADGALRTRATSNSQ